MSRLEHLIPPPLVAVLCAALMWAIAHRFTPLGLSPTFRIASTVAVAALGLLSAGSGALLFWRRGANIDPHKIDKGQVLVTGGPYRVTRNPMYLGIALVLLAYVFYLACPLALAGPLLFVLYITRFQILPEERAMLEKFGETYAAYRRSTRRWI